MALCLNGCEDTRNEIDTAVIRINQTVAQNRTIVDHSTEQPDLIFCRIPKNIAKNLRANLPVRREIRGKSAFIESQRGSRLQALQAERRLELTGTNVKWFGKVALPIYIQDAQYR